MDVVVVVAIRTMVDAVVVVAIRTMVDNDNDNKTQVMLNLVKCNISQLCMMLMLVYIFLMF